jgi:hypothetical protein
MDRLKGLLIKGFGLSDQSHADTGFQRNVQYFFNPGNPFYSFPQEAHRQIILSLSPGTRDNDRFVLYPDKCQRSRSCPPGYWLH